MLLLLLLIFYHETTIFMIIIGHERIVNDIRFCNKILEMYIIEYNKGLLGDSIDDDNRTVLSESGVFHLGQ